MKIVVTGAKGQLGYDVVNECKKRGLDALGVDIEEMDITDCSSVKKLLESEMPDAVIHCAAYTAVDAAEDNTELCRKINVTGTRNIASVCAHIDAKMLYLSTDYVFPGDGENEWKPDDEANPLNFYGKTKYEGELAVKECLSKYFIIRISWVFGKNGKNFIKTMLNLGKDRDRISVVNDQTGSPTYTYDLSKLICDMIVTDKYGTYHATNEGLCSWYEFAEEIFKEAGMTNVKVLPVDSSAFAARAKRPKNSRMSKDKLDEAGFNRLPTWQDALKRYLKEIGR